jgi:hypothetical protein
VQLPLAGRHRHACQQHAGHGVTRPQAPAQQARNTRNIVKTSSGALHGGKGVKGEARQHAGQQRRRQGLRDAVHDTRKRSRVAPARVISSAHTMKAPTAFGHGHPHAGRGQQAAPGVDQAVSTGWR